MIHVFVVAKTGSKKAGCPCHSPAQSEELCNPRDGLKLLLRSALNLVMVELAAEAKHWLSMKRAIGFDEPNISKESPLGETAPIPESLHHSTKASLTSQQHPTSRLSIPHTSLSLYRNLSRRLAVPPNINREDIKRQVDFPSYEGEVPGKYILLPYSMPKVELPAHAEVFVTDTGLSNRRLGALPEEDTAVSLPRVSELSDNVLVMQEVRLDFYFHADEDIGKLWIAVDTITITQLSLLPTLGSEVMTYAELYQPYKYLH
ncbi:hypothetical protein BDV96DRAFT_608373 [Lophiotrema nucula]|uniref:Uncharacterized protein n=1 Tax=Lophiotrema nucula TaxID=690887 RepID=A0A6A5YEZ3_9PLEO|nr:hypothetical protein BDV96DRAFT_608373 [Lophiotrema nucula]